MTFTADKRTLGILLLTSAIVPVATFIHLFAAVDIHAYEWVFGKLSAMTSSGREAMVVVAISQEDAASISLSDTEIDDILVQAKFRGELASDPAGEERTAEAQRLLARSPSYWRPIIARMLVQVSTCPAGATGAASGASACGSLPTAVVLDARFERPVGPDDPGGGQLGRLALAIHRARKNGVEVVLPRLHSSPPDELTKRPDDSSVPADEPFLTARFASASAPVERYWDHVQAMPIFTRDGGCAIPSLPVAALCAHNRKDFCLGEQCACQPTDDGGAAPRRTGGVATCAGQTIAGGRDEITLVASSRPLPTRRISEVLGYDAGGQKAALAGKVMVVGFAMGNDDVHPPISGLTMSGGEDPRYGVWTIALALRELLADSIPTVLPRFWTILAAWIIGFVPFLLFWKVRFPRLEFGVFASLLILAILLTAWGRVVPLFSAVLASAAAMSAMAMPRWSVWRRACRIVRRSLTVNEVCRSKGLAAVTGFPPDGPARLVSDLSRPVYTLDDFVKFINTMQGFVVEETGNRTFFQSIPAEFFEHHEPPWMERETRPVQKAAKIPVVAHADDLDERFIGSRIRRIRNLVDHEYRLKPHAIELGYRAISSLLGQPIKPRPSGYKELSSAEYARLQLRTLHDVSMYLADLTTFLFGFQAPAREENPPCAD